MSVLDCIYAAQELVTTAELVGLFVVLNAPMLVGGPAYDVLANVADVIEPVVNVTVAV